MKLIIDIPEQMYQNAKADTLCGADIIVKAIKNGIPHETVTDFADRCRECGAKYGKLLKQVPSGDAISRQAVLELVADYDLSMGQVVRGIHALPSVTPQEPKTGHWVEIDDEPHEVWECDHCGFVIDGSGCIEPYEYLDTYNFCPNCGTKMFEPRESEDEE